MTYPLNISVNTAVKALTDAGYRPALEPHAVGTDHRGRPCVHTAWPREQYRAACPLCEPGEANLRIGPWSADDYRAVLFCINPGCPSWAGASTEAEVHHRLRDALSALLPAVPPRATAAKGRRQSGLRKSSLRRSTIGRQR